MRGDASLAAQVAALVLIAGVCLAGWRVVTRGRRRWFPWADKALLLTLSVAAVVLGSELFIKPPAAVPASTWQLTGMQDPNVQFRYAPYSTATTSYPDNPRGYFEKSDPFKETWSVETHGGSEGRLEHLASEDGAMRVTISKLVGTDVFNVKLNHATFQIAKGAKYVLRFRAKADRARTMNAAVGNYREPWEVIGLYAQVDLASEWKAFEYAFVATGSDPGARIYFDLGASDAPVELSDVVLHNQSTGKDEAPALPPVRYHMSYRFNSLGFRGPDRAIPRPEGTRRIVVLGDSFALGEGVREEDTFSAQLEKRLGTTYEVINTGVSGYATRQELLSYELFASKYEPHIVLITMVYNDDMSYLDEVARGLIATGKDGGGLTNLWTRVQQTPRTYDYTDSLLALRELNELCMRNGAKLAVVLFTTERSQNPWAQMTEAVTGGLKGSGIPILNLADALFAEGRQEIDLRIHPADGHPNEVAHRIAAQEIEQFLRSERLLPP